MGAATLSSVQQKSFSDQFPCVARIVAIDEEGRPLVTVSRILDSPTRARSLVQLPRSRATDVSLLPTVAVGFEEGDPTLPIIVGWIHDRIVSEADTIHSDGVGYRALEALVDG